MDKKEFQAYITPFNTIGICTSVISISGIMFAIACSYWDYDSVFFNFLLAITTGIIASSVVTIVIEAAHNHEINLRRSYVLEIFFTTIKEYHQQYEEFMDSSMDVIGDSEIKSAEIERLNNAIEIMKQDTSNEISNNINGKSLIFIESEIPKIVEMCNVAIKNVELLRSLEIPLINNLRSTLKKIYRPGYGVFEEKRYEISDVIEAVVCVHSTMLTFDNVLKDEPFF